MFLQTSSTSLSCLDLGAMAAVGSKRVADALTNLNSAAVVGVSVALVAVGVGAAYVYANGKAEVKGKRTSELGGGSLKKDEYEGGWSNYYRYFQQQPGTGVTEKEKAPEFVDTFYNLVTDIYEWGWGQSFHFSPAIPGKSHREATIAHEEKVADLLQLKPGMKVLDAGCGVGGPMRAIARKSGSNITGVTINKYQVDRATQHNQRANLANLCQAVQGNFLALPFEDNSFDAAYSIEATCHAPDVRDVYKEIFRVLKPGQMYATYEWVKTHKYDPNNAEHVKIIDDICFGNALPELRTHAECEAAAKEVGFEVVENYDLAAPPANPWWTRLKMSRMAYAFNHVMVTAVTAAGIAPKGLTDVHEMLTTVAVHLTKGGETGIFSPAHLLLLRKPAEPKAATA